MGKQSLTDLIIDLSDSYLFVLVNVCVFFLVKIEYNVQLRMKTPEQLLDGPNNSKAVLAFCCVRP